MRWLVILVVLLNACNSNEVQTPVKSSDSSVKAIDPKGTLGDTTNFPIDSLRSDSNSRGLTH